MPQYYEHGHEKCNYVIDKYGVPVCRLNVLPCARVPDDDCDMEGATERRAREMTAALRGKGEGDG